MKAREKKLPEFDSLDDLVNFFDENDFGEFDERLKEVHFDVDLKGKKYLVEIDEETNRNLAKIAIQEKTHKNSKKRVR